METKKTILTEDVQKMHELYKELDQIRKQVYETMCSRFKADDDRNVVLAVKQMISERVNTAFSYTTNLIVDEIKSMVSRNVLKSTE